MNYKKVFYQKGYIHLNKVFNKDEIDLLRNEIEYYLINSKNKTNNHIYTNDFLKNPKLYSVCFKKKIIDVMKNIFGPIIYWAGDFHIQYNLFPSNSKDGWHYDAQSEAKKINLKKKNFTFAKIGIYLQDNTLKFGGGIDIVKYSHRLFPINKISFSEKHIKKLMGSLLKKKLDILSGDVVIFDSKLLHKGSYPEHSKSEIKLDNNFFLKNCPKQNQKYTIYWDIGHKERLQKFKENNLQRALSNLDIKNINERKYYYQYLKLKFPNDFPKKFVNKIKKLNINIVNLDKRLLEIVKEIDKYDKIV